MSNRGVAGRGLLSAIVMIVSVAVLPVHAADPGQRSPDDAETSVDPLLPLTATDAADARWSMRTDGLIVTLDDDQAADQAAVRAEQLLGVEVEVDRPLDQTTVLLALADDLRDDQVERAAAQLAAEGHVRTADPDVRLHAVAAPDDPEYPAQWHLHGNREGRPAVGIGIERAWARTPGSPQVHVAVLDTGVVSHPDLDARIADGYNFVERNDDPTDRGLDCERIPGVTVPPQPRWHGLHVTGIVGAVSDNGIGIAGVDQQARIRPVRVISDCGGTVSDLIDGIRWSAGLPVAGVVSPAPVDVINLSLGGTAPSCPPPLRAAIEAAVDAGVIVVAAVGNDDLDLRERAFIPASCPGTIAVSATSPTGDRAGKQVSGSSRVPYASHGSRVDISAPGGDNSFGPSGGILSLTPDGGYGPKSGTSMAAPQVAGVAALLRARDPSITPTQVRRLLARTAQPFPLDTPGAVWRCGGRVIRCGAGILDAGAALGTAPSARPRLRDAAGEHATAIAWMVDYGITRGCDPDGRRFCPHEPVTRAQAASFIARALNLTDGREQTFVDVDAGSTHAAAIDALRRERITDGCSRSGPRFCPADAVTRQEIASLLVRAERYARRSSSFVDVSPTNRHAGAIGALAREGVTRGCDPSGRRYCPRQSVTRGQLASMLYRALA